MYCINYSTFSLVQAYHLTAINANNTPPPNIDNGLSICVRLVIGISGGFRGGRRRHALPLITLQLHLRAETQFW